MITIPKLRKKLKGIGFVPPAKTPTAFWEIYVGTQELMASKLDENVKLKGAFYTITYEEEVHWGLSGGILFLSEDKLFYAGFFGRKNETDFISFNFSELEKVTFIPSKNEGEYAGFDFEHKGELYRFTTLGTFIPTLFVKEIFSMILQSSKFQADIKNLLDK